MIGNSALREIISSYPFRPVARSDLIFSVFGVFALVLRIVIIVQSAFHDFHRLFSVFELRPFVLTSYDDTRWQVSHSYARFGFVDVLSARAARTISINLEILFVDVYFNVDRFGKHGYGNG